MLQFLDTASAVERKLDHAFSYVRGVSFSEYRLLSTLSKFAPGGLPRVDLANAIGLTASAVCRAIKPLEKLGYVKTERSERDARQSRAVITPAGIELLQDVQSVFREILGSLPLSTLSQKKVDEFRTRMTELRIGH